MQVRVIYTALLSVITKKRSDELELKKETSVSELIGLLSLIYGDSFRETVIDQSTGKNNFPILVNGAPETINYVLNDKDTLAFIMAMSGG